MRPSKAAANLKKEQEGYKLFKGRLKFHYSSFRLFRTL